MAVVDELMSPEKHKIEVRRWNSVAETWADAVGITGVWTVKQGVTGVKDMQRRHTRQEGIECTMYQLAKYDG